MYIKFGSYELYMDKDFVIRQERRKFQRIEKSVSEAGDKSYECIAFGYLMILSVLISKLNRSASDINIMEFIENESTKWQQREP